MNLINKFTSRKFWLAVAAFIAAFVGMASGALEPKWSVLLMALSAGIYAACEAYVDGQAAKSTQTINTTSITATSASQKVVEKALAPEEPKEA